MRTIEDTGISVPGVGEVFFDGGEPRLRRGRSQVLLPASPPLNPHATRDYDGVEVRFQKRLSQPLVVQLPTISGAVSGGNYSGLASSDENGRTSPNVNRYFDALYPAWDDTTGSKQPVMGLLPTD